MRIHLPILLIIFLLFQYSVFSQPPCATNPIADDFCSTATPICNLNGYCGNTSASYTNWISTTNHNNETNAPLGNVFCATIQNNSWLKFVASANTAIFDVWVSNCANNHGIQMQIYETTDCYNFTAVSNCLNPMTPTNGQITATGLVPGQVYYFMIDGTQGDICDYVIAANTGVVAPAVSPGQSVCAGTTVAITASGGSGYNWTSSPPDPSLNGQTTNASIHVAPTVTTVYSVNITIPGSNTFCPTTTNILTSQVTIFPLPDISLVSTPDYCGLSNGTTTVHVVGDSTAFDYLWSTLPQQTSQTANGLSAGMYAVTVTDSNSCSSVDSVQVIQNLQLNPTITGPSGFCDGNSIQLDAGSGFASYLWSNNSTSKTIQINQGGTYSVTVTIGAVCSGIDTITVSEFLNPKPHITGPPLVCSGVSSIIDAGGGFTSYLWSTGAVSQAISVVEGGTFSVSVTDSNQCNGSDVIQVPESTPPLLSVSSQVEVCQQGNGSASVVATPAGISYSYLWNTGDTTASIFGLAAGNYSVTVNDNSCTSQATVVVGVSPGPQASFVCHPYEQSLLDEDEPVTFYFYDQSLGNISTWQWDFDDNSEGVSSQNSSHGFNHLGVYYITLTVTDSNGCFDTYTDSIEVIDIFTFYIPNAFSPNGDGINDVFTPKGNFVDPDNFAMYIYDEWGKLMFSTTKWIDSEAEAWNGTHDNKGSIEESVMGIYAVRIFVKEIKGIEHEYKGIIALVR
jgi:gliding motility-associated-like protein